MCVVVLMFPACKAESRAVLLAHAGAAISGCAVANQVSKRSCATWQAYTEDSQAQADSISGWGT